MRPFYAACTCVCIVMAMAACRGVGRPAMASTGPTLVIANQRQGIATLIDLNTGAIGDIDLGMDPHEAAASPDGKTVALAVPSGWLRRSTNKVALIDVAKAQLLRTIDLGEYAWPHGVAFLDARTLLVSSRDRAAVVTVDVDSGRVTSAIDNDGAEPYLLHLVSQTQRAYTSNPGSQAITEIDLAARQHLRTWKVPEDPAGFAVSPRGDALWFADGSDAPPSVSVIDVASGVARRIDGFTRPRRLAFSPDGTTVVITDANELRIFDARSRRETGRVALGNDAAASGVTFGSSSALCYVALSSRGSVVEVDLERQLVKRTFHVGAGADGIAFAAMRAPTDR